MSFNPHPRMGGDKGRHLPKPCTDVSIHTPAWGATFLIVRQLKPLRLFQSTPPHGGRHHILVDESHQFKFQSTPPHGGRRRFISCAVMHIMFQSTPPHGGRLLLYNVLIPNAGNMHFCEPIIFHSDRHFRRLLFLSNLLIIKPRENS